MRNLSYETHLLRADNLLNTCIGFRATWHFRAFRKGKLLWKVDTPNLIVNVGLDDSLDKYFKGSTYTAAFYVGLKLTGTPAAADTMASHASWAESSAYDEAVRQTLTLGSVSGQSVDNSASPAIFTIDATITCAGGFLTTDNTKGGTSGTLFSATNFSTSRALLDNDTLEITITETAASA